MTGTEITVIEDEKGLLFLGDEATLVPWLESQGLSSRDVSKQTRRAAQVAGAGGQLVADVMENSGRWVKLTEESAKYAAQYGAKAGVARDAAGRIVKHLNFEQAAVLASPAGMAAVAGMMSQMALQQSLDEINEYLEVIDKKIEDLLQDQKDQTLAQLFGVSAQLATALAVRDEIGYVSATSWSTVSGAGERAASAQGYAIKKLDGLARKLSEAEDSGELAAEARKLNKEVTEWLAILAGALRIHDQLSVIEIDRMLEEDPAAVEGYKRAMLSARAQRLTAIEAQLRRMGDVMEDAVTRARQKKVLHPLDSDAVIRSLAQADTDLDEFADRVGIASAGDLLGTRRWKEAAGELAADAAAGAKDLGGRAAQGVVGFGAQAADGAKNLGGAAADKAKGAADTLRGLRVKPPRLLRGKQNDQPDQET